MQHFSLNGFNVRCFASNGVTYLVSADVNNAFGFQGRDTSVDNVSITKAELFSRDSLLQVEDLPDRTLLIEFKKLLRAILRSNKSESSGTSEALLQMLENAFFAASMATPTDLPALPPVADDDRVQKLATAAANRYQPSDVPKDAIKLPGWLTVSEMLISLGEDPTAEFALIKDNNFRYWINRQMSDIYRAQFGDEPPAVNRKKGCGYCYPKTFTSLVKLYRGNWLTINS
jgi:hypothetical protein